MDPRVLHLHALVLLLLWTTGYALILAEGEGVTRPACPPTTPAEVVGANSLTDVTNHPNWRLLPTDYCGSDVNDRIYGGEEANLMEYPWLALLRYRIRTSLRQGCVGVLISNRYVLTAAHCTTGLFELRLLSVILGEHNTNTDPDCVDYIDGRYCGDPKQEINIDDIVVHPEYTKREDYHDIALLRLDREAVITYYIIPICLPNGVALSKRYDTESMIVAGWGKTKTSVASDVKLWVRVPVMSNSRCSPIFRPHLTLHSNQMCAGGERDKGTCVGDSGGPLMTVDSVVPGRGGGQWVVAGLLSTGFRRCGSDYPDIYTRIAPYVGWILDSLKL